MKVSIHNRAGMSHHRAKALNYAGSTYWWIQNKRTKKFLPIGIQPATHDLNITIQILPGEYTIGCGTRQDCRTKVNITTQTTRITNGRSITQAYDQSTNL